jgi:shikimate kinase
MGVSGKTGNTGHAFSTFMSETPRSSLADGAPTTVAHLVLLGLMGTGKTVVARELAPSLQLPLSDNDAAIGAKTELSAREIRDRHGTQVLHGLEAEHLLNALAAREPSVICAAGSVVENERCRQALARPGLLRIWLRAQPETLAARFHNQDHRPLLGKEPLDLFTHQVAVRSHHFAGLCDAIVDVDGLPIPEVVRRVLGVIDGQGGEESARRRTLELDVEAAHDRGPEREA